MREDGGGEEPPRGAACGGGGCCWGGVTAWRARNVAPAPLRCHPGPSTAPGSREKDPGPERAETGLGTMPAATPPPLHPAAGFCCPYGRCAGEWALPRPRTVGCKGGGLLGALVVVRGVRVKGEAEERLRCSGGCCYRRQPSGVVVRRRLCPCVPGYCTWSGRFNSRAGIYRKSAP